MATLRGSGGENPLQDVIDVLYEGRHYFWIGIYLVLREKVVRQVFRGPVAPCFEFAFGKGNVGTTGQRGITKVIPDVTKDATYSMCFVETKSEIVVPIKIGTTVLGVIDVESDRPSAFGSEDRVLLEEVAHQLARFLTTNGKFLIRKAREKTPHAPTAVREQRSDRAKAS
jgi:putative methionine-R-sulfoxide reductase with GAF domain